MEQSSDSWKELYFAKYLYCTSSSMKVSNNFINFNARAGVSHKEGTSQIGSRSFAISGNFEADSPKNVEAFRSEIFASLFNKPLHLYLDDEDDNYYNCVLDGNVSTTYNQGYSISRVFTLSFNLIATEPYRIVDKHFMTFLHDNNSIKSIDYKGSVPSFLRVGIQFHNRLITGLSTPLVKCRNTTLNFKQGKTVTGGNMHYIKKGITKTFSDFGGKYICVDFLDDNSKLYPLMLMPGKNTLEINLAYSSQIYTAEFSWKTLSY